MRTLRCLRRCSDCRPKDTHTRPFLLHRIQRGRHLCALEPRYSPDVVCRVCHRPPMIAPLLIRLYYSQTYASTNLQTNCTMAFHRLLRVALLADDTLRFAGCALLPALRFVPARFAPLSSMNTPSATIAG